jgi:hypothetical protein
VKEVYSETLKSQTSSQQASIHFMPNLEVEIEGRLRPQMEIQLQEKLGDLLLILDYAKKMKLLINEALLRLDLLAHRHLRKKF